MADAATDILIVSAVRTAIGDFGGALKSAPATELGAIVIREALRRANIKGGDVHHVVMGHVIQGTPREAYLARIAAVEAGVTIAAPALTLNRLCGSGLQAIVSAAQMVRLGEAGIAVAGGTESMSNSPHVAPAVRWGQKMGPVTMLDAMVEVLTDPFGAGHMGMTAENIAKRHGISRTKQDELAAESHRRAACAIEEGRFREQIVPVEVRGHKGVVVFDTDEHVRGEVTAESLAALRPAFTKEGSVTAGNASGLNDGAAAVVLASGATVAEAGLKPLARIVSWGHAGVEPDVMGLGPIEAVPIALDRAGLSLDDIDIIESNEAFAAQACAVAEQLGFDSSKTNPNGSGIALGHPVGATGAILVVKALYELRRTSGRYGLITMCIGGGQGIAMVIERLGG
ncbi:MAG TPA: beta-ketothiolase BktB [Sphingomonas sp.]|uniref:beta-ketothiolase BktB n=1 Tax=Sphingomonas sp. TaxID=28214 RepID=UPI002C7807F6|nr:beta-ketothiolase BktB [Sphingomonas sp.]HMI19368.1 beta-ketothiolase BktB [Sphingomonas sp.]